MQTNGIDKSGRHEVVSTGEKKGKKGIPPQVAWPLFVVGLLALGVGWSLSVVIASRFDGGAQVIDDYYDKAVNWDEAVALRRQSDSLGWTVDLQILGDQIPQLVILVRDREGRPVTGLQGDVKAFRPQRTRAVAEMPLVAIPDSPGVYRHPLQEARRGLWDFEITAQRNGARFYTLIRKELLL